MAELGTDRCSTRAALRGDPLIGTAFPAGRVLLVEQPRGWGPAGLADSRFDPRLAAVLTTELARVGVRVLAARRPGRAAPDRPRTWVYADCRAGHELLRSGEFAADADLVSLLVDGELDVDPPGDPATAPVYAVCTHGTHDVCCAVRGRPVAAALERLRPGRVWECSHVGGDRFAANLLVLPHGLLYGRVTAARVQDLVAVSDRSGVVGELLRGRIGLPPAAQAALAFEWRRWPDAALHEIRVLSRTALGPGRQRLRLTTPGGPVDIEVLAERGVPDRLTCRAPHEATALSHRVVSARRAG